MRPFETAELGDVGGCHLVHLQCHFGLDTLSWARKGALVTGVDFSPIAVAAARDLALRAGLAAEFVEAGVYDAVQALDSRTFDVVYTSIGTIIWLPDITRWASTVAALRARWAFLERRPDRTYHMPADRPQVPLLYSVKATRPAPP